MRKKAAVGRGWAMLRDSTALAVAYFAAAELGRAFSLPHVFTTFWPPNGVYLAALLLMPMDRWPLVLTSTCAANLTFNLLGGASIQLALSYWLTDSIEVLLAAAAIGWWQPRPISIRHVPGVLTVILIGAVLAPIVGATLGATAAVELGGAESIRTLWRLWWSTDFLGVLLVAPAVLAWFTPPDPDERVRAGEWLAFGLIALLAGVEATQGSLTGILGRNPLLFVAVPGFAWATWRLGMRGATLANLLIGLVGLRNHLTGRGLMASIADPFEAIIRLQLLIGMITFTGLLTAAALAERRRIERALAVSEARFRELTATAQVIPWELDPATLRFTWVGAQAERALGYPLAEWLESNFWQTHLHPDDREAAVAAVGAALTECRESDFEYRMHAADGRVVWLRDFVSVSRGASGPEHAHGFLIDVTAAHDLATALQTANDTKSQLLANVSHEIRTPISAVIGMTDMTLETDLTPDQRDNLQLIRRSANTLLWLINDLLDLAKMEAGQMAIEATELSLHEVIEDVGRMLAPLATPKGLELVIDIAPDVPVRAVGDPDRLRQILLNLAANAVKFTEIGEVTLTVRAESRTPTHSLVRIDVADTGIGIPKDRQARIFDAFVQADGSTTRRYGGTGLGLTISRQLVERMGGQISVDSVPGIGSAFHIELPMDHPPQAPIAKPLVAPGGRALIADDNRSVRGMIAQRLSAWGMDVSEVDDARTVLQSLREASAARRPFTFVFLDAGLPSLEPPLRSTIETAAQADKTRVVLLIAGAAVGRNTRTPGIETLLLKPLTTKALADTVAGVGLPPGFQPPVPASVARTPSSTAGAPTPLRVLVADDNHTNRLVTIHYLAKYGHAVTAVENGRDAVAALTSSTFDVVLMDCQMPVMDGFAATAAIRAHERTAGGHVPIIAVTAHATAQDRERCLAAGMNAYLSKPFDINDLTRAITDVIDSAQRALERPVPAGAPTSPRRA